MNNTLKVVKITKVKNLKKIICQGRPFQLDLKNLNIKLVPSNFAQLNQEIRILSLNDNTTIIGDNAFEGASILGIVDAKPKIIGKRAFYFCQSLTGFPFFNVTELDESAFEFSALKEFIAGNNLKQIPNNCFANCYHLNSAELTNVEIIEHHAFDSCPLYTITFPISLKKIGNYAFQNCAYLKNIVCLSKVPPLICENTFNCCDPDKIWVIDEESANRYASAKYWSNFSDKIQVLNMEELQKRVSELGQQAIIRQGL